LGKGIGFSMNTNFFTLIIKVLFLFSIMLTIINAKEKYTNSLINEESPYLQQHAHNPVNWYAWNKESFEKAKKENKMIFLSIGYSTCHWCHVMEEESFENEEVAKLLNKHFISIKVDREEMPHVDKYYQDIHNLVNRRSGGWPLTIILSPQRKAFYAATYIPLNRKYGRSGIIELLNEIQKDFEENSKKIYETANSIQRVFEENKTVSSGKKELSSSLIKQFIKEVDEKFDHKYFGIGDRPKFPHSSTIESLLDIYKVEKDQKALILATKALKAMAKGGIHDQIEGGFYRYSVDEKWMIPHFEKMLYTNAELLSSYSKAYDITGDDCYKEVVEDIIAFTKERFEKNSLLYSASDADSLVEDEKKEEGAYFVFIYDEVLEFLENKGYGKKEIEKIVKYFNLSFEGNFENGLNNPYLRENETPQNLKKVKADLKELRSYKEYPFIDYKILTSWNSLYISSLFEAKIVDEKNALKALILLDSLLENLYLKDILYHQRLLDRKPKVKALFEDYSFLTEALLKAYDFSLDENYLKLASKLNKEAIEKFYKNRTWQMSDDEFKFASGVYDSAYKSAQSQMIDNLLKLALLNDDLELQELAKSSFENNSLLLASKPSNTAWLLRTYMAYDKGYISLKARKEMFKDKKLNSYPFLLRKLNKDKKYLACKVGVCFAYSDDFEEILSKIEKDIRK
jgi:uncharacterized protein YyaL (SSP411 family)